jgi:chromosome partitioning protein
MKIITAAVIKGGTGKTTTAAALAQAAKRDRMKVLAIDLDPQANLTFILNGNQNQPGSVQLLHGEDPLQLIQITEQGIDLIAASPDLAAEKTAPASAMRLQQALEPIKKDYDFIFIDTPPQMGELTFNALQAADGLIIPLETDSNSIQGLYQVTDIARQIQNSNPNLSIIGCILTRYDKRANLNRYLRDAIEETGQEIGAPLIATIRPGIAIREAQALQRSLYEYAPKSNPAADYLKLYKKIKKES